MLDPVLEKIFVEKNSFRCLKIYLPGKGREQPGAEEGARRPPRPNSGLGRKGGENAMLGCGLGGTHGDIVLEHHPRHRESPAPTPGGNKYFLWWVKNIFNVRMIFRCVVCREMLSIFALFDGVINEPFTEITSVQLWPGERRGLGWRQVVAAAAEVAGWWLAPALTLGVAVAGPGLAAGRARAPTPATRSTRPPAACTARGPRAARG